MSNHLANWTLLKWVVLFYTICNCNSHIRPLYEELQINRSIAEYFQIEEKLWAAIQRREENTLELIYQQHKIRLNDNQFQNIIERNRIGVDLELTSGLRFINDTTTNVFNIIKSRDYGGLIRFSGSYQVKNITDAMEKISRASVSADLWRDLSDDARICKQHYTTNYQSEHQLLVEVYKDVETSILRGYMVAQLAYMILGLRDFEKYRNESQDLHLKVMEHNNNLRASIKEVIPLASRDMYSCSPDNYVFESTEYEMITGFLEGFVDNEINLNKDFTCKNTCDDYKITRQYGCHNDTPCGLNVKNQRIKKCKGILRDCEYIGSTVEICPSSVDMKRYKYLKYDNGRHLGDKGGCAQPIESSSWTDWFVKCHNCFCICDEYDSASDRYFSLRDVVSDIESNHIVTGIHIAKPNRIIELVISERKLLSFGRLKPTNNYFHFNYPTWTRSHPKLNLHDPDVKEGIDYHTLTYKNRSINFDTVVLPQGHVVTGVRFALFKGHLRLEVRATEFDFETGTLTNLSNSTWIGNDNGGRLEIYLNKPKPIGLHGYPIINNIPDSFVRFTPTDKESDASQTIVPYLETTKVEPIVPVPLSGVGLVYKGRPGHGGVIAPKLVVYNFETII